MTSIRPLEQFPDDIQELIASKEHPDEWYVLNGKPVGEYSVHTDAMPEEFDQADLPPEERDATENVDGFYQIGSFGWASDAFADDCGFVSEYSFSGGDLDARVLGLLLVHESMLSEEALDIATEEEVATDGGDR